MERSKVHMGERFLETHTHTHRLTLGFLIPSSDLCIHQALTRLTHILAGKTLTLAK